jgi:hypothetical protein
MTRNMAVVLFISTILYTYTILFVIDSGRYQLVSSSTGNLKTNDKGRNERSTPRSFILPATPAVAIRQEEKLLLRSKELQIKYCMLKLYDLGYKIMDFEDIFGIHISIALIDFQARKLLPKTGKLDERTVELLGCEN